MGIRFRRSFKIAPGVRVNLGKKGASMSFGTRGARYTVHSSGRRTTTVGIPGTGISYSSSSSNRRTSKTRPSASRAATAHLNQAPSALKVRPAPAAPWYRSYSGCWILGGIGIAVGVIGASAALWMLLFAVIGIVCIIMGFKGRAISAITPVEEDVWQNAPAIPFEKLQAILCPGGTWKQLAQSAQMGVPQWERIIADCESLMESTMSPDTYFSRYALLRENLNKLAAAECVLVLPAPLPSERLDGLDEQFEDMTVAFIERTHESMIEKAALLKTENGKRNRRIKYYSEFLPHADSLTGRALDALTSHMEADGIREDELE